MLGENYCKEMVSDLNTFAHKGCQIAAQKKVDFWQILPYYQDFFGIGATIRIGWEMLCLPYAGFFEDISTKDQLTNKSVSNQGVPITAPATPGLLKSCHFWDPRIWLKMVMPYLVTIR